MNNPLEKFLNSNNIQLDYLYNINSYNIIIKIIDLKFSNIIRIYKNDELLYVKIFGKNNQDKQEDIINYLKILFKSHIRKQKLKNISC